MDELLTPTLIRAARALLRLDQAGLAASSGISRKTIMLVEADERAKIDPRRKDILKKLREHLENEQGVEFTFADDRTGEGVRLKRARTKTEESSTG